MTASELVLTSISASYGGRSPPLWFLVNAWAETIHHVSEQLRMTKRSANDVVGNIAGWENRWKWAPAASSGTRAAIEPDNHELQNQVKAMQGQVKAMQRAAHQQSNKGNSGGLNAEQWNREHQRREREDAGEEKQNRKTRRTGFFQGAGRGKGGGKGGGGGNGNRGRGKRR